MSRAISLIVAALVLFLFYGFDIDNKIQQSEERTIKLWSVLENRYQQRDKQLSVILKRFQPQVVNDKNVQSKIAGLREKLLKMAIKPSIVYDQTFFEQFIPLQNQLDIAISHLFVVIEQSSLGKTEVVFSSVTALKQSQQLLKVARHYYDKEVDDYNLMVSKFPGDVFAGLKGYQQKLTFRGDNKVNRTQSTSHRVDFNKLTVPSLIVQ